MGERGGGQTQAAPNRFLPHRQSVHGVSGPPPSQGSFIPALCPCAQHHLLGQFWGVMVHKPAQGGLWTQRSQDLRRGWGAGAAWQGQHGARGLGTRWCPAAAARCAPRPLTRGETRAKRRACGKASAAPAPRVLLLPRGCAKMTFIFFCFFTLCCKFALNEYVTGIILEHITASQPKPSSSLPVGPPGPGYQPDRISRPGGPGSHWGWAAGPVGVPRTPASRERSPSLLLAGQGALPRFSEVDLSTRLLACGPAASGALVLSHALCPGSTPSPAPDLAQDWWRPEGVHRQFAPGCAQPVGRSMGEGKALAPPPGLPAGSCGPARPAVAPRRP